MYIYNLNDGGIEDVIPKAVPSTSSIQIRKKKYILCDFIYSCIEFYKYRYQKLNKYDYSGRLY